MDQAEMVADLDTAVSAVQHMAVEIQAFGEALVRALAPAIEAIRTFAASVDTARLNRRLTPTPWHYKQARWILKHRGEPFLPEDVEPLARQLRVHRR